MNKIKTLIVDLATAFKENPMSESDRNDLIQTIIYSLQSLKTDTAEGQKRALLIEKLENHGFTSTPTLNGLPTRWTKLVNDDVAFICEMWDGEFSVTLMLR